MSSAFDRINRIRRLFKDQSTLTLKEIKKIFPDSSERSLSRDLRKIGVITSFSHAGQYRIVKTTPKFNLSGLWFYLDIGFSKYGTLKSTVIHLIEASKIGHTHKELNNLLKLKTHNTLKSLVVSEQLSRRKMPNNRYVYLHRDNEKSVQQYNTRLSINTESIKNISPPSQWVTIEILAEIIRAHNMDVEVEAVLERLSKRGIDINKATVENVLSYYQIKKNGFRNNPSDKNQHSQASS